MEKNNKQKYYEYITQWQQSGKRVIEYCKEHHLSKSIFYYYWSLYKQEQGIAANTVQKKFVQLPSVSNVSGGLFTITYPNGTRLCIGGMIDEKLLIRLVHAVS